MGEPKFHYANTPEKKEKQEQPIPVINVLERLSLPTLQKVEGDMLSGIGATDIDDRALRLENCPNVVFGRPHAGEYMPKNLWERSTEEAQKTLIMIDRGTSFTFRSEKIPSVGTKMSRWIVDPNRTPVLDAANPNVKTPGKVLWRQGVFNESMYQKNQEPTDAEVTDLVEKFYLPYYNGMMATIGSLLDRRKDATKERVLVIDGHTFVSTPEIESLYEDHYKMSKKEIDDMPAFIIGDLDGQYCDSDIREAFAAALQKRFNELSEENQALLFENMKSKKLINFNHPFKGVHNVKFYGQREQGVNCLQVECNEDLYVDCNERHEYRSGQYNKKKMELVRKLIEQVVIDIDPLLKNKKST